MSKIVEVAGGVLLRANGQEFLLAQRPEGKVYAGYWEFPGGKVETGESVRDALIRELQEELGITVTACSPWLSREFTYPHARVRLNFWRAMAHDPDQLAHVWGRLQQVMAPGALDPLLGRPISIFESNAETGEMTFVYQTPGRGTARGRSAPSWPAAGFRRAWRAWRCARGISSRSI